MNEDFHKDSYKVSGAEVDLRPCLSNCQYDSYDFLDRSMVNKTYPKIRPTIIKASN